MTGAADPGSTERTRVRRLAEKAVPDRAAVNAVLDAARVAHVAVVEDGQPYVVPVAYARRDDAVLFHGSTGSRLFRALAAGQPTCFTVTLLDALVLARSAFESSMNYRSVMALGRCTVLAGDEKALALRAITDHLLPGRWEEVRQPSAKESAATMVLSLPLGECSLKVSAGGPSDAEGDEHLPVWGGIVPVVTTLGDPVPDEHAADRDVPPYIAGWQG